MSVLSAYDLSMSFIERKLFDSITFTLSVQTVVAKPHCLKF